MGFLGKLFGSPKQKGSAEVSLDNAKEFAEKHLDGKRKQFNDVVGKKFSEIKHVLIQAGSSLDELQKQPLDTENAKLGKIVSTSRQQTISRFSSLLDKLQPPKQNELAAIRQYCIESNSLLQHEVQHFGKSIAYTGIYLKAGVKNLGASIKELSQHFTFLAKTVEEFGPVFLESQLSESVNAVLEKSKSVSSLDAGIEKKQALLETLSRKKKGIENELSRLSGSDGFKQLGLLQEEKAGLFREKQGRKTELVGLVSSIDKPLRRFSKAVYSGRIIIPRQLEEPLRLFQSNPLQLLKRDPKGETVKEILSELREAITAGLVELKPKEKEKKLSAIDELLAFNFFSDVFWKLNELDSKLQAIEKKMKSNKAIAQQGLLEKKLSTAEKEIQEAGFSLDESKNLLERTNEEIVSLKQKIEDILKEISALDVVLK